MKKASYAQLQIKVVPNASKNQIVGWEENFLKIRLNAAPEKGKANKELIIFLAKCLDIPKSSILLEQGETNRYKKLQFSNIDQATLLQRINDHLSKNP